MGKNLRIAVKIKDFTIYPYLLKATYEDAEKTKPKYGGYRGVNIRIVYGQKIIFDVECHDEKLVRIKATEFQNGYITAGWSKEIINSHNNRIDDLVTAVRNFIATHDDLSKPLLMATLYGTDFAVKHKKRRRKYVTIPVIDFKGVITTSYELEKNQIDELLKPHLTKQTFTNSDGTEKTIEGIFNPETGENAIGSEEDFYDVVTVLNEEKIENEKARAEAERIANMAPADKYKEGRWNASNIFEAIGYLVFGTERKGKNHKPILNPKFHNVLKRLILYRENNPHVSTSIKDFNDEWIYEYYNWISERNAKSFMRSLEKPNPFKFNDKYVMSEGVEYIPYSFDTFRDNIHKEVTMTIGSLLERDLIPKKIKLDIEDYGETSFGKKIFSLAPSEFLSLLKAKSLSEIEEQVRDAFSVMVWTGNRPSDYRTDKSHTNIDGVVSVQFVSPKTGLAIDAFLSPPVQKIYERWSGFPDVAEQKFNSVLRSVAERLKLNRIIEKPVSRVGEERKVEKYILSDFISQKFGRGTYYTIGALTGRSFDELMNVAGHTDKSIVNRHYWNVGAKVSGEVKRELNK
jgi:hypothetical protein